MVFFGDLGTSSGNLVSYFEDLGATLMKKGENPATVRTRLQHSFSTRKYKRFIPTHFSFHLQWMLNVLGEHVMVKGESGEEEPLDFAKAWKGSANYADLQQQLEKIDKTVEITYKSDFACKSSERNA